MTEPTATPTPTQQPRVTSRWERLWSSLQIVISLAIAVGALMYLTLAELGGDHGAKQTIVQEPEQVQLDDQGHIRILAGSTLEKKLEIATVRNSNITLPMTTVNGTVVASNRGQADLANGELQFAQPEMLTAHTDWQRAVRDVKFFTIQVDLQKQLAAAIIAKNENIVTRLEKLVKNGTESQKDLDNARTDLLQAKINAQKDIYQAETDLLNGQKTESSLARQLRQSGLDPELLQSMTAEDDLVVAEVPEARMMLVKQGQACDARFVALPGITFRGHVTSISPIITKDRRTLRVLFALKDPEDRLRPGMFAEIGLGTDPHDEIIIPADGVLHVGRTDFVLKEIAPEVWQVIGVDVGEARGSNVQIVAGIKPGDRVLGMGAILLKPFVVRSLTRTTLPVGKSSAPASATSEAKL